MITFEYFIMGGEYNGTSGYCGSLKLAVNAAKREIEKGAIAVMLFLKINGTGIFITEYLHPSMMNNG